MGFSQHLINLLLKNKLVESVEAAVKTDAVDFAKLQIETKVGGDVSDKNALQSSFEAIEQALDSMAFEYFENAENPGLDELFSLFISKERIDFFQEYTKMESDSAIELVKNLALIDLEKEPKKYLRYIELYSTISERLQKIYTFIRVQLGETLNEAIEVDPATRKKLNDIVGNLKEGVMSFKELVTKEEKKIDSIPETGEGRDQLKTIADFLGLMGLSEVFKDKLDQKEKKIPKEKDAVDNFSIYGKKRIIKRLLTAIQMAELPAITEGRVEKSGDYFKLFTALKAKNAAWMQDSLEKYVFGTANPTELSEFRATAENEESALEEHQLVYLKAGRSWIQTYIESDEGPDGKVAQLNAKEKEKLKSDLNTYYLEKEKEIKNYYVSRDFSLGNFGGLQIKPEIRLPLYTKVNLPVSEEDRKKESPLRNILKGAWSVVGAMVGGIPTTINYEKTAQVKRAKAAIFNGLNSIITGGVTLIGGKQAGRDYAEAAGKLAKKVGLDDKGSTSGGKVREDMLSITDSPGFIAVNPEAPGQMMQTPDSIAGGMDTFALAGPQRKAPAKKKKGKKKSKKPTEVENRVSSFADFMQRK